MKKAYSHNGEDWEYDWDTFLDVLMNHIGVGDTRGLIGAEYFEGDQVPVTTDQLVDIDAALDMINETAWEIMGEHGEDYPNLSDKDKAELKGIIVSFLDKKDPRGYFKVEDYVKKTITAEDLAW
jgi:hypothetical protein